MTEAGVTQRVNILLVDDQPSKLLTYEVILRDLDENLIKTSSANEAFGILLKQDVAVLLVDVSMPELNGFEFVSMLRQHPRFERTAVIFISAIHLSEADLVTGYATGAVDYVPVPVVPEVLRAKVRVFTELHRKTRQLEQLNADLEQRVVARTRELEESARLLRESEERFRLASEAAQFGAFDYDLEARTIFCSPHLKRLLGADHAGDLTVEEFVSHIQPGDRDAVRAIFASAEEGAHELEFRTSDGDGNTCWRQLRSSLMERRHSTASQHLMGTVFDITGRKKAEERQNLLMGELDHRVKNVLAVISAVANLSKQSARSVEEFIESLDARIAAMSEAHNLLRRNNWTGAQLGDLVSQVLEPLRSPGSANIAVCGDTICISPRASQSLALVLHELATNASKYGALSVPEGRVSVTWQRVPERGPEWVMLRWAESGGPAVAPPRSQGFGITVINAAANELGASADCLFETEGVKCTFEGPFATNTPQNPQNEPQAMQNDAQNGHNVTDSIVDPAAQTQGGAPRRILIVEDEPFVAMLLKQQLEDAGHIVVGTARTVAEGISLARDQDFDAALVDVTLGEDLSAPVANELINRGIPFAFSTGYTDSSNLPGHLQTIPRILKPYTNDDVIGMIGRLTA